MAKAKEKGWGKTQGQDDFSQVVGSGPSEAANGSSVAPTPSDAPALWHILLLHGRGLGKYLVF